MVPESYLRLPRKIRLFVHAVLGTTIALATCVPSAAQSNSLGSLTQGQPVVANGTGSSGQTASSSDLYLDASQFSGSPDICAQIQAAYQVLVTAGIGGTIDARSPGRIWWRCGLPIESVC
jgi:hypothetical protein